MNYLTVEHLEQLTYTEREKKKIVSFLHEIKMFALFLGFSFIGVTIFTNANVFMASLSETLNLGMAVSGFDAKTLLNSNNSISNIMDHQSAKDAEVNAIISQYSGIVDDQ
jgi:hypothetical protein